MKRSKRVFFSQFLKHTSCEPLKKVLIITHIGSEKHFKSHNGNIVSSSERNDTLIGKCPVQGTGQLASEDESDPTPIVS